MPRGSIGVSAVACVYAPTGWRGYSAGPSGQLTLHIGRCHARAGIPHALDLIAQGKLAADVVTARVAAWEEAPEVLLDDMRKCVVTRSPAPAGPGLGSDGP